MAAKQDSKDNKEGQNRQNGDSNRMLVLLRRSGSASARLLATGAGVSVADAGPGGVLFSRLGVAVVTVDPEQEATLRSGGGAMAGHVLAVERVRRVRIPALVATEEETGATWGAAAVRAQDTPLTGSRVGVAILDTGVDAQHPDLAGRVTGKSFVGVAGAELEDVNGHGTHCAGIACGALEPAEGDRYGVAGGAQIYAGKVLDDDGEGDDEGILAGIEWAIAQDCRVVSMSLGAPASPGEAYSRVFETVARRALRAGTALVAAAGNGSSRAAGTVAPVGHPANCPSILAVGAVDRRLRLADFSNGSAPEAGGQIDLVAPGVDVRSAWPVSLGRYRTLSGTSMAAPHVAGVLALFAQAQPEATARELLDRSTRAARRLAEPATDVGAGLVQAPLQEPE